MDAWLREFLLERKLDEKVIQKLQDENIDETVIPLMSDSELAKYIPKVGDRVSTVAFCRQAAILQAQSGRESLITKLQRRLSGAEGMSSKKSSSSKLAGNTNAKRKRRRIEVGWMDFDEKEQRYKQVKSVNGGGTKHLSIGKEETVADIQVMAENIFFPNGHSKKNKALSHYSTHMESSQIHVDMFNTVEELYDQSKVKILRLYLCTKKKVGQLSSAGEDYISVFQPTLIHLNDGEQNAAFEDLLVEERDSESPNHPGINDGASTSEDLDTLPLDSLSTLGEVSDAAIKIETDGMEIKVAESLSASAAGDVPEAQGGLITLRVRRGNCLGDMIKAFKNPEVVKHEVNIKMFSPDEDLELGERLDSFQDCLATFWTDFYNRCTLGTEAKVPFIRHDFQCDEWQAVARVLVVGWKQTGYFPVKLAVPFLEEALYGSTACNLNNSLLLYLTQTERDVLLKALENFNAVDKDELLNVLDGCGCKEVPSKDTLLAVLAQIGHKIMIQSPMYVIQCWHPIVASIAHLLPPDGLGHFIAQRKGQKL